jgi:hypothetical protein
LDIQNLPVSIVVKGDWTQKLWIGPAILAGLAATGPSATLESTTPLTAPPPMPAHVQAAVTRALASPSVLAKLSPSAQAFLRALASPSGTTPSGTTP